MYHIIYMNQPPTVVVAGLGLTSNFQLQKLTLSNVRLETWSSAGIFIVPKPQHERYSDSIHDKPMTLAYKSRTYHGTTSGYDTVINSVYGSAQSVY